MNLLAHDELLRQLNYNTYIGIFRWKISKPGLFINDIAGHKRKDKYIIIRINNKNYYAHILAWFYVYGKWPNKIDHINRIKLDNRFLNLRSVSTAINGKNRTKSIRNTSGVTGVYWYARDSKWQAKITINGKGKHLGLFNCITAAMLARKASEFQNGFTHNHGK